MLFLLFHFVVKIGYAAFHARWGHKGVIADVVHFQALACFTRQDHYLSHYIGTTQVKSWIGFGITFVLRLFYYLGKAAGTIVIIKYKVQCTAQYGFNMVYHIAT